MKKTNIPQPTTIDFKEPAAPFMVSHRIPNTYGWAMTNGFITTDSNPKQFKKHIEDITAKYIIPIYEAPLENINMFLVLHHANGKSDIYVNNIDIQMECRIIRDIQEPGTVKLSDFSDIRAMYFDNINIVDDDSVVWCFRINWSFGLYINIRNYDENGMLTNPIDLNYLQLELADCYKRFRFNRLYEALNDSVVSEKMYADGWFPFLEISARELNELFAFYSDEKLIANTDVFSKAIDYISDRFDKGRIDIITSKWWDNPLFTKRENLLKAGIDAFLQFNGSGYINSINTLYPQIEGIIRVCCFNDKNMNRISFKDLITYLEEKSTQQFNSLNPLSAPKVFCKYLDQVFLKNFDLNTGEVDISRHTTGHGVANAEDFTKVKAIQAILILDQLCFYLP